MKRNIYLLFAALLTAFSLQAQVVQTTPEFPTLDQSLTIRFFANLGNGGLNNCNCDVFLHIGLITIESTDNSDWQNVPTEWGVELPDFKMTRTGANSYQYNIDDIRAFFEVSDSVEIRQIAILFRDAAGNRVGRDSDGGDFFIDIFDNSAGVFAVLNAPLIELQVFEPGDSIEFEVSANKEVAWTFIRNEEVIFESSSNSNQIDYTYFVTETESGLQAMTILAEDADGAFRDSVVYQYLVKVKTNIATVPSGLKAGITRGENGKVSFVLVAPNKGDVYLDGSRSANWPGDDLIQMNRTPDGERYWVEIEGFEENEWYVYTYLLPGELRIADPFSELIINGSEDRFIPENVNTYFPNPGNTEFENLSAFKYEGFPYEWQVTDFEAVPVEEMFVYELLVRDMFEERSYQNLIDTLDYLERLGVNAIELMPVNEFEGNESWGYNPSFHMALDKYYGDPITFKAFIDEAHKRGMAVIVDIVLNHAFGQSPLNRLYWDAANFRPTAENPWLNPIARHPFNVGYDFNHESTYTKEFSQRITQYWLEEFKIDGYRFDLSKGFTQKQSSDDGVFRQYDASRIAILNEMADYCRVVNPNAILILEHFGANNEETELSDQSGFLLWGNMHGAYKEAILGFNEDGKSDFSGAYYKNRGWDNPNLVVYMESHDEQRQMYDALEFGNSNGNYNIQNFSTAIDRIEMAHTFFWTIPGPKMMWQFGEHAYDFPINYCPDGTIESGCRVANKPVVWEYFEDPDRRDLYDFISDMTFLRRSYTETFQTEDLTLDLNGAVKLIQLNGPDLIAIAHGNFDIATRTGTVTFPNTGMWYDYVTGDSLMVSETAVVYNMAPGQHHLWLNQRIERFSDRGFTTSLEEVTLLEGISVYPNPVTAGSLVNIELEDATIKDADIRLLNTIGQETAKQPTIYNRSGQLLQVKIPDLIQGWYLMQIRDVDGKVFSAKLLVH